MDTFENTFGHFWNFENVFFLKIFENSTLHGTLGKKIFRKICPKTLSKHFWILLGTILGIFGILKRYIFKNFRRLDIPWNTGLKFFFRKNHNKTRLDTFGNTFGHFLNFENIFFENFRRLDIPWKTGQKFVEKFAPKHVQNMFGDFRERFWAFLNFEKFLIFKKNFEDSTLHGTLGIKFFENFPQNMFKTRLDTFENTFGLFWNFEKKFSLKIFKDSTFHGKLGKNFWKSLPQNMFKSCLDTFGNDFGHF